MGSRRGDTSPAAVRLKAGTANLKFLRAPRSLTQRAVNKSGVGARLVMPGLVLGIHALAVSQRKTWMAGTSPAMTESLVTSDSLTPRPIPKNR